jgi:malonyl-CoA O-methyltransferase
MPEPSDLDRSSVRRQFERRAQHPDPADFLLREVEHRMLERLDLIRLQPQRVLDVGCGTGAGTQALARRWPSAEVLGIDLAESRVSRARAAVQSSESAAGRWVQSLVRRLGATPSAPQAAPARFVVGDAHALPLADASVDLVWSNLVLHWFDDVPAAIAEWYRVIRPDGLLMFTALGVDTLIELRSAGARLPTLPDMHDIGDALLAAGFAEPVMDTERLTITWADPLRMLADVRALGGDASRRRPPGLSTPRQREALLQGLARRDLPMGLSFELIHGHAWCSATKRRSDGFSPVTLHPRRPARGGT